MEAISQPGNLAPTTDPAAIRSRAERVTAFQKETAALQADTNAISRELQAVKQRTDAVQSKLIDLKRARAFRDLLTFVSALAIAALAVVGGVRISSAQRRHVAERSASLRAQGIDPAVPSERVKQLAGAGNKIAAIKIYREETGAWLVEAKDAVEFYLAGKRREV